MQQESAPQRPSFWEAFRFWLKLGFISFGGPAGQIAILHSELVERKKWISESRFLHALNYCMLLPGPEATQLAIYTGWLMHRIRGGITAGVLFVLPSIGILWLLSYVYVVYGKVAWIAAALYGLKPAVLAIVVASVIRLARRALRGGLLWGIAVAAFVAIYFFHVPFPFVVAVSAIVGFVGSRFVPYTLHGAGEECAADDAVRASSRKHGVARMVALTLMGCVLWWVPVLMAGYSLGWGHTLAREGIFFSKAALVTFGGAYAVLPYVSQQAVSHYGWLSAGQMLDGLGLAETTPGPLIMVLQFVGFLGAWHHPGALPPLLAATLGAAMTTWVTFVPSFLFIFMGAPYIESLRGSKKLSSALTGITAAVVGVVLNLAVWFATHVLWKEKGGVDFFALTLAVACLAGMIRWQWGVIPVVLGSAAVGVLWHFLF